MVSLSHFMKSSVIRQLAVWLFAICSTPLLAQNAPLTAFVDRTDITQSDIITLTIRVDATLGDTRPSFAGLNQDFDQVGGIDQRSTYTNSNGNVQSWTDYRIALRPKTTGTLTIPSFRLGSATSGPITIKVSDAPQSNTNDEIFLRTSVSKDELYVQEELLYTIRIYYSIGFDQGAQLSSPQVQNAVIQQLGSDEAFSEVVDGIGYNVTERRFVIYPQSSGELSIPSVYFTATVGRRGLNRWFNNRTQLREINLASEAHLVNVKTRPASFPGQTWLPASKLTLEEEWSGDLDQITVGDAITRNIVLTTEGLSSSLLPGIDYDELPGLRFYPDQPVREDSAVRTGVTGIRREGTAIVASRAGQFTLPAVELPWWNTTSDSLETAVLPARTITVMPAPTDNALSLEPESRLPGIGNAGNGISSNGKAGNTAGNVTLWMSATGFFAAAWLLTLMLWLQNRKQLAVAGSAAAINPAGPARAGSPVQGSRELSKAPAAGTALRQLKIACGQSHLQDIRAALLDWGRASFETSAISNLAALARCCADEELSVLCKQLDAALYARDTGKVDCQALYAKISDIHKHGSVTEKAQDKYALRPLYKNRT